MRYTIPEIKSTLLNSIKNISKISWLFSTNPEKDFSRNRKLSFEKTMTSILCMGGGSLTNELMDCFSCSSDTPSTSAFVQQRAKILPEAFETLFRMFTDSIAANSLYKGYRLLAVDGSDLQIPTEKNDADSYYPGTNGQKPYNLLHLNALYDLCVHTYVDAIVQKSHVKNEHKAFVKMVDRCTAEHPTIFIADRGYESYNNMAHIQEKGMNFVIRIKDFTSRKGIASGLELPDEDEFDMSLNLFLTRKQTNKSKELFKNRNSHKFIASAVTFDYLPKHCKKSASVIPYELRIRILRFKITENTYEVVATNLDAEQFPAEAVKKLYAMRWGIETSFRDLKYTVGLLHFHSKKAEYIIQEIFAKLTMYNFTELITSLVVVRKKDKKYSYKANFSAAVHVCRKFFFENISPPDVEALILKYVVPIRPNRKRQRKMSAKAAISFMYRIA